MSAASDDLLRSLTVLLDELRAGKLELVIRPRVTNTTIGRNGARISVEKR